MKSKQETEESRNQTPSPAQAIRATIPIHASDRPERADKKHEHQIYKTGAKPRSHNAANAYKMSKNVNTNTANINPRQRPTGQRAQDAPPKPHDTDAELGHQ